MDEVKTNNSITDLLGAQSAVKDAEGKPKPIVIQQITVRPINRNIVDIEKWRNALKAAEATVPRRVELYDLYEEMMLDAHLTSVIAKRIMAVTNIEWQFLDKTGKEVEAIKDWIDTPDFELIVSEILNSKIWGYTMLEFDFYADRTFGIFNVPRKHMRPQLGVVSFEQTANSGINIRAGNYADTVFEAGDPKDLGLLLKAAPLVIYKRGNWGDWAQFIERFGQPLIDAIWDGYDESQRLMLLQALEGIGSGGQIVRPQGTQLQFLQGGSNNPTGELNNNFKTALNDEISVLILGQTETTTSSASSGYAQAAIHGQTENDINVSDVNFVRRLLNKRLLKIWEANGIAVDGGKFTVKANKGDVDSKAKEVDVDVKLKNVLGLPISDDYLYEKYGIDKPADYDVQKAALLQKAATQQMGGFGLSIQDILKLRDEGFFGFAP